VNESCHTCECFTSAVLKYAVHCKAIVSGELWRNRVTHVSAIVSGELRRNIAVVLRRNTAVVRRVAEE